MGRAACEVTDYLAGEGVDGREYFVLIAQAPQNCVYLWSL